jgi:PAS domain S-box-containing protein
MRVGRRDAAEIAFAPTEATDFGMPVAITDSDFRLRTVSDYYCEMLQGSREEITNIDWRTIVHQDDLDLPQERQALLIAAGDPYEVSCRLRRKDGIWLQVDFLASRLERGAARVPLIQSSARFRPIANPAPQFEALADVPVGDEAVLEYIQSMATELTKLAAGHRLSMIQHLLSMVSLEAAEELQRRLGAMAPPAWFSKPN